MKNALGNIGTVLLGACGLPLLMATIRVGHANGVDPVFLALWLGGELAMLGHVLLDRASIQVRLNIIANTIMVGTIGWYKWVI